MGHVLAPRRAFDTKVGVTVVFEDPRSSCNREIWMDSAHRDVPFVEDSGAVAIVEATGDFAAIGFIDEGPELGHVDRNGVVVARIVRSKDSCWHNSCRNILNMCRTVSDHSHLEIVIFRHWINEIDSSVAKTFEAKLDGDSILNKAVDADRPFEQRVRVRQSCVCLEVIGRLIAQLINASNFKNATLRHRTIGLIDTVKNVNV